MKLTRLASKYGFVPDYRGNEMQFTLVFNVHQGIEFVLSGHGPWSITPSMKAIYTPGSY